MRETFETSSKKGGKHHEKNIHKSIQKNDRKTVIGDTPAGVPVSPTNLRRRHPADTQHTHKDNRTSPTCMCLTYVPHSSPGKFATVTSRGPRVEENSEKGDLQEWNFKKR